MRHGARLVRPIELLVAFVQAELALAQVAAAAAAAAKVGHPRHERMEDAIDLQTKERRQSVHVSLSLPSALARSMYAPCDALQQR